MLVNNVNYKIQVNEQNAYKHKFAVINIIQYNIYGLTLTL